MRDENRPQAVEMALGVVRGRQQGSVLIDDFGLVTFQSS